MDASVDGHVWGILRALPVGPVELPDLRIDLGRSGRSFARIFAPLAAKASEIDIRSCVRRMRPGRIGVVASLELQSAPSDPETQRRILDALARHTRVTVVLAGTAARLAVRLMIRPTADGVVEILASLPVDTLNGIIQLPSSMMSLLLVPRFLSLRLPLPSSRLSDPSISPLSRRRCCSLGLVAPAILAPGKSCTGPRATGSDRATFTPSAMTGRAFSCLLGINLQAGSLGATRQWASYLPAAVRATQTHLPSSSPSQIHLGTPRCSRPRAAAMTCSATLAAWPPSGLRATTSTSSPTTPM